MESIPKLFFTLMMKRNWNAWNAETRQNWIPSLTIDLFTVVSTVISIYSKYQLKKIIKIWFWFLFD